MEQSKAVFCPHCAALAGQLEKAKGDPGRGYAPTLQMVMEMEQSKVIELFAGDCPLEDVDEVLYAEQHYTVCHYLRCKACGAIYFVGACIRGKPVYRRVEDLSRENLAFRLWGRCGSYFQGSAHGFENGEKGR